MSDADTGMKWLAHFRLSGHETWVYVFPGAHFVVCCFSYAGAIVPPLRAWAPSFQVIFWSDWPVSALPNVLGPWEPGLAEAWIFLAGSAWWFVIGCVIEAIVNHGRRPLTLGKF
ncbi:MAG TPA: hypothetical protein VGD60_08705 [Candidatus Acidoferrales bacterium]